jgi:hypothetical protein
MLSTAVAAAAVNVLLAYALARLLKPGRVAEYGPEAIAAVLLLALLSSAAAAVGWRAYLRRRASPRRAGVGPASASAVRDARETSLEEPR